jgi:hypothetical protein
MKRQRLLLTFVLFLACIPGLVRAENRATGALFLEADRFQALSKAEPPPGAARREPRISMRPRFPTPRDQGDQFSCAAFAVAYALKSYMDAVDLGVASYDDDHIYSPAFIYNQGNNHGGRSGIYIQFALSILQGGGCCSWKTMPYNVNDADTGPTPQIMKDAKRAQIARWDPVDVKNIDVVKSNLVTGTPIVIGAWVDVENNGTWPQNDKVVTDRYLHKGDEQNPHPGQGYHAMVLTGYDDAKGAFEIMNSWGTNWNQGGYGWIDYNFWRDWVNEGYIAVNSKRPSLAPGAAVTPQDVKWLPVGPEGKSNGNWGFPWNVNLKSFKPTKDKTLPTELKQYLTLSVQK